MKLSSKMLLILLMMAALAQIDAAKKAKKGIKVYRKFGKFRPRSPQRYIVKCCTGSCWNPSKSNKRNETKIHTANSALTTLKENKKVTIKTLQNSVVVSAATTAAEETATTLAADASQTMQSSGQADGDVSLLETKPEAAADAEGTTIFTLKTELTTAYERSETGTAVSNNSAASTQTIPISFPSTSKNETSITMSTSIATPVSVIFTSTLAKNSSE